MPKFLKFIGLFILFELARIGLSSIIAGMLTKGIVLSELNITLIIATSVIAEVVTLAAVIFPTIFFGKTKKIVDGVSVEITRH